MRAYEFISESFEFLRDLTGKIDVNIFCELFDNNMLHEEADEDDIKKLQRLIKLAASNISIGSEYWPIVVISVRKSEILVTGSADKTKLINIDNNTYKFANNKEYPYTRLSDISYFQLYLFDDENNMNKFLNLLSLMFDKIKGM